MSIQIFQPHNSSILSSSISFCIPQLLGSLHNDSEALIEHLRRDLLESNIQHYRDLLDGPMTHPKPDSYAMSIRDLYARLSEPDRAVLFSIIRQTIVDTASSILVILDGDACVPGYREDFFLRYGTDPEPLNGELQDLFLAAEEEFEERQRE